MASVDLPHCESVHAPVGASPDRWLFHLAWAIGAAVFLLVGSVALLPADPEAAVSILTHERPWMMLVETLGLSVVTAAIATAVAGRRFADVGLFAVSIGIGLVTLRGGNMTSVLMDHAGERTIALRLMADGAVWCMVMVVVSVVDAWVSRWLFGTGQGRLVAEGLPWVGRLVSGGSGEGSEEGFRANGVRHAGLLSIVAVVLIGLLSTGRGERAIQHGQACFAVAGAFYIAAGRAQVMVSVGSNWWAWLSVPVVCVLAMGYSLVRSTASPVLVDGLPSVPVTNYLQILPVTYVTFGTGAVLLARWRCEAAVRRSVGGA